MLGIELWLIYIINHLSFTFWPFDFAKQELTKHIGGSLQQCSISDPWGRRILSILSFLPTHLKFNLLLLYILTNIKYFFHPVALFVWSSISPLGWFSWTRPGFIHISTIPRLRRGNTIHLPTSRLIFRNFSRTTWHPLMSLHWGIFRIFRGTFIRLSITTAIIGSWLIILISDLTLLTYIFFCLIFLLRRLGLTIVWPFDMSLLVSNLFGLRRWTTYLFGLTSPLWDLLRSFISNRTNVRALGFISFSWMDTIFFFGRRFRVEFIHHI